MLACVRLVLPSLLLSRKHKARQVLQHRSFCLLTPSAECVVSGLLRWSVEEC